MTTSSNRTPVLSVRRRVLHRRRTAVVVAALPVAGALLVTGAVPALADGTAGSHGVAALRIAAALGEGAGPGATALRVFLLAAATVTAGLGLVRLMPGLDPGPSRAERTVAWVAAGTVAVTAELAYFSADVAMLGTVAQVLLALAVPALLGSRWVALPALPLAALLAAQLGTGRSGWALALDVGYALAAALLAGTTLHRLTAPRAATGAGRPGPPEAGPVRTTRAGPRLKVDPAAVTTPLRAGAPPRSAATGPAVAAGTLAVATGTVQILLSGPHSGYELLRTGYGLAALAAVVLPALGTVAWVAAARAEGSRRAIPARSRELQRFAGIGAIAGLAASALLAALPVPAPAAVAGEPLLRAVDVDGQRLALLVTPMRPGPNLVHLGGTGYPEAGTQAPPGRPVALRPDGHGGGHHGTPAPAGASIGVGGVETPVSVRPGAGGGWAVVDIPEGTGTLTVTSGLTRTTVPIDVGTERVAGQDTVAGPDGPECASAVLGALLAHGRAPACPSETLEPTDAAALRATVRQLGEHGVTTARLVSDGSPRSVTADRLVREEGKAAGIAFPDRPDSRSALIVVSGWGPARTALQEAALRALETPTFLGGTYLAPWLLTGGVVTATSSSILPLPFSPQEPGPQRYAGILARTFPGDAPSTSGYLAWARATGVLVDQRPTLFGAAPVDVPMTVGAPDDPAGSSHHGGGNPAAWFPGGTVVPISAPLDPA